MLFTSRQNTSSEIPSAPGKSAMGEPFPDILKGCGNYENNVRAGFHVEWTMI
jgi:hypothetical protein